MIGANRHTSSAARRLLRSNIIRSGTAGGLLSLGLALCPAPAGAQSNYQVLHTFTLPGPGGPNGLMEATDGNFYGTTAAGGQFGDGTVYRMTQAGDVTVLHSFLGTSEGSAPAFLTQGSDGALYGATGFGGNGQSFPNGYGTLFRITLDGSFTVVWVFSGGGKVVGLAKGLDGSLYGSTRVGGLSGSGFVFQIPPDGRFSDGTLSYSFPIGAISTGPLVQALDGSLYGTTFGDGYVDNGTVFRLALDGTATTLHTFTGGLNGSTDGGTPAAGVIQGIDGNFYGTTVGGGDFFKGTVFQMTPSGDVTILYSFTGGMDGGNPQTPLLQSSDGGLYGVSPEGGANGAGVIFRVTPDGSFTVVYQFGGGAEGIGAFSVGLIHATDGNYYGTAASSDNVNVSDGLVFRLDNPAPCDDTLTLDDTSGTLTIGYTLRTPAPAFWGMWLVTNSGAASLWQVGLPSIDQAVSSAISIPAFPSIGPVSVFSVLISSTPGVVCFDGRAIYTGP